MVDTALQDLLALLGYGSLQAFDRLAADARLAPDLRRRAMLAEMAAAEIASLQRLLERLGSLTDDPYAAMAPFAGALDSYHEQTEPKDWLEALTKAYVGDGIADDFYGEIAEFLGEADRALILDVLHSDRYAGFAAEEIRAAIGADPAVANRLSMWARRLVGEAMSQAVRVAEERPALAALVATQAPSTAPTGRRDGDPDSGAGVAAMFKRITAAHTARMAAAGLNL